MTALPFFPPEVVQALPRHIGLIFTSQTLAFILSLFLTQPLLKFLKKHKLGKQLRDKASTGEEATIFKQLHAKKQGTPTMGGILIWGTTLIVVALSEISKLLNFTENSLLNKKETLLPILALISTAILGAFDDYLNIKGIGKSKGLNIKPKFLLLTLFGLFGGLWFHFRLGFESFHIPFIGDFHLGVWYIPLFVFIITATSNAVNITDGLDGLAGGLLILSFICFSIISFFQGLFLLSAFCAVIVGALFGFLWSNIIPAKFYMGDTGAISLGTTLGVIAMLTDSIAVLPFICSIFVLETISVILQTFWKKYFKRKLFLIAPIHHHFEKLGWSEASVVMRFWIIGGFIAFSGLIIGLFGHFFLV